MRTIIAFIIAPIGIPIILALIGAVGLGVGWQNQLIGASLSFAPYMVLTAWVLGTPVYFLLFQRVRWFRWWQYVVGGALIALIPFTVFAVLFSMTEFWRLIRGSFVFMGLGGGSSLLFWAIAIRMRPNKSFNRIGAENAPPG